MTVQINALDHVNLRAPREMFERLRTFYRDVLGLHDGPRPDFGTDGAWMYIGDHPIVHLSTTSTVQAEVTGGGASAGAGAGRGGSIDHVAFKATDPEAAAQALRRHGVEFRVSRSDITRQHQYFFLDPAGNGIELNFPYGD